MSDADLALSFLAVWGIAMLIISACGIVLYILQGLGIYHLSQRLGLKNPWLGFIPVANSYALARIGDQAVAYTGKRSSLRKWVLGLAIGVYSALYFFVFVFILMMFTMVDSYGEISSLDAVGFFAFVVPIYLLILAAAIALQVLIYISLYRVYKLFDPRNATIYLILSIFVSFTSSIFLFIIRNKQPQIPGYPAGGYYGQAPQYYNAGPYLQQPMNQQPYAQQYPYYQQYAAQQPAGGQTYAAPAAPPQPQAPAEQQPASGEQPSDLAR